MDNIKNNLSERKLSEDEAQDRVQWRRLIRNIDPHVKMGKDAEEEEVHRVKLLQPVNFIVITAVHCDD